MAGRVPELTWETWSPLAGSGVVPLIERLGSRRRQYACWGLKREGRVVWAFQPSQRHIPSIGRAKREVVICHTRDSVTHRAARISPVVIGLVTL